MSNATGSAGSASVVDGAEAVVVVDDVVELVAIGAVVVVDDVVELVAIGAVVETSEAGSELSEQPTATKASDVRTANSTVRRITNLLPKKLGQKLGT